MRKPWTTKLSNCIGILILMERDRQTVSFKLITQQGYPIEAFDCRPNRLAYSRPHNVRII